MNLASLTFSMKLFMAVIVPTFGIYAWLNCFNSSSRNIVRKPFHMWRTTLHDAVGTPSGLILPGQVLLGLFLKNSAISSGDPLGISTLKYFITFKFFLIICSTPKAIWTALLKSMFLYHPGNTALKALVLKQTECFISLIAIAQKIFGRPAESAARIARRRASIYLFALSCSLNTMSLKSGFILLSKPVPRSASFIMPTFTLNALTLGIRLKLLSKILPPLCALEVTRSLTMAETRESTPLNLSKESFIIQY